MLRPGFPRLSHPGVAHAIPSIAFIAQVYRGRARRFLHDLGGKADRSTATGASTRVLAERLPQPPTTVCRSGQPAKSRAGRRFGVSFCATGGVAAGYGLECSQFCVERSNQFLALNVGDRPPRRGGQVYRSPSQTRSSSRRRLTVVAWSAVCRDLPHIADDAGDERGHDRHGLGPRTPWEREYARVRGYPTAIVSGARQGPPWLTSRDRVVAAATPELAHEVINVLIG